MRKRLHVAVVFDVGYCKFVVLTVRLSSNAADVGDMYALNFIGLLAVYCIVQICLYCVSRRLHVAVVCDVLDDAVPLYEPDDAADVPAARDAELVVYGVGIFAERIAYRRVKRVADDAADVVLRAEHCAEVVDSAVERNAFSISDDAADVCLAVDRAGVDEVLRLGLLIAVSLQRADDAADVVRPVDVRGVRYVFDERASRYASCYRADVFTAGYQAAVERDVADYRAVADLAEEADVIFSVVLAAYRKAEYVIVETVEAPLK